MDSLKYNNEITVNKTKPLWKWLVELLLGSSFLLFLYGCSQTVFAIPSMGVKIVVILLSSVASLTLLLLWAKLFEKSWRFDLLKTKATINISLGLLIGILYSTLVVGIFIISGYYHANYASPDWSYIILCLCANCMAACFEEVIFRGIVFRMIDERFGFWWAIGTSAVLFCLIHIGNSNVSVWGLLAISIEAGILLGAAFKYSGSLLLPIGIHLAWNFTQGNVFGFTVSGGDVEESILESTLRGPDYITGGPFGPEASLITITIGVMLSILFIRQYFKINKSMRNFDKQKFRGGILRCI